MDSNHQIVCNIKPIGFAKSLYYFGVPAIVVFYSYHFLRPYLVRMGVSDLSAFFISLGLPMLILLIAALIHVFIIEKNKMEWVAFSTRVRLPKLHFKDIVFGLVILAIGILGYGGMSQLSNVLISSRIIILPQNIAILDDPSAQLSFDMLNKAAGGSIYHNWSILFLYLVVYLFNILGEELWWRGVVFPKQELSFGKFTWILHGVFWTMFHMFKWWDLLNLLPFCLALSFIIQKRKSTWTSIIAHACMNLSGLVIITLAVFGLLG